MRVALAALLCLVAAPAVAATYYVNNSGAPACSDATVIASNTAAAPWCTIGRAVWGDANRTTPSAAQAITAGDTVEVMGGTYNQTIVCPGSPTCRFNIMYNPTNEGTVGNFLTIRAVGTVILAAPDWDGPVAGCHGGQDYVRWIADVSLGYSFTITSYAPQDDAAPAGTVDITPDTGPVVMHGSTGCHVEGFILRGGGLADPYPGTSENYPGMRAEQCTNCVMRNNDVRDFREETSSHGVCFQNYHSPGLVVEYNYCASSGSGISVKNDVGSSGIASVTGRFNLFTDLEKCVVHSIADPTQVLFHETNSVYYQNICANSWFCWYSTGDDGVDSGDIFNNTCYNVSSAGVWLGTYKNGTRFWNNIIHTTPRMINGEGGSMPASTLFELQHSIWYNATVEFYEAADGDEATLAAFNAVYANQNNLAPASIATDPQLANPAGGDYRHCTAAGVPHASCAGASPAINLGVDALDLDGDMSTTDNVNAGAYVTGSETIGLQTVASSGKRTTMRMLIR